MDLTAVNKMGFDNAAAVPVGEIVFDEGLVELCKKNVCGNYGRNYTCPPLCGETAFLIAELKRFESITVFQKIYPLEDSFDFEGMAEAAKDFGKRVVGLGDLLSEKSGEFVLLGAGGCGICETCGAIDGTPCRDPKRAYNSLESCGIYVSKLAESAGMKYINGADTVTYFGGVFS
jgi:predicted metal-binding protein